jgi:hypothetical protein
MDNEYIVRTLSIKTPELAVLEYAQYCIDIRAPAFTEVLRAETRLGVK